MAPPRSRYTYDEASGRYREISTGRYVSAQRIREEIDLALLARERQMRSLAEQLRTNQIGLDVWASEMRVLVKDVHLYSAAAAKGGWAQMSQADYGRVGQLVRVQYEYLNGFVADIASGKQMLDGRFLRRVALYGEAGRATFHTIEALEMDVRGMDEERNVLHPADHCGDCVSMSELGWVQRGKLIPIGQRQCLTGCHCTIEYRSSAA